MGNTGIQAITFTVNDKPPVRLEGEAVDRYLAGDGMADAEHAAFAGQVREALTSCNEHARSRRADGRRVTADGEIIERSGPLRPPPEEAFEREFLPAPELEAFAAELIERYPDELGHLAGFTIRFLWRAKGGTSCGIAVLSKPQRTTGMLSFFAGGADFVSWLAADHLRPHIAPPSTVEDRVLHELLHMDWDTEKDQPFLRPHDFEGFLAEVRLVGLANDGLKAASAAFEQLRLKGVEAA